MAWYVFQDKANITLHLSWIQDLANPLVRTQMFFYPSITKKISEFHHAAKYVNGVPEEDLTPMWADFDSPSRSAKHFYVRELAELKDGSYAVPLKWVDVEDLMYFEGYRVSFQPGSVSWMISSFHWRVCIHLS